ncbi:hypothetical protein BD289DRAFT_482501 [Coniella lustricola]|uniref:Uncharacterized protein n=1 Tax=Coniella lustricola TaxID=2025994 RepID=A0A2T3A8R1_9PEZI|nr:hypothetical protein BD289DRAFT_482501 [Coniella lustricola]
MKSSPATTILAIFSLAFTTAANAGVESTQTRAQQLAQQLANGETVQDVTVRTAEADSQYDERYLVSPGAPFLCQNGDPLHNASRWEYFEECLDVNTCEVEFGGYSVAGNWCGQPHDSSNECCVESLCAAPYDSTLYSCVDIDKWPYCGGIVGGPDLCPGPDNVRCCKEI